MITKSEVKYIQSLGHKKFRDELKQFVAEGPKIVTELLSSPGILLKGLYACKTWWEEHTGIRAKLPPEMAHEVTDSELERISFLSTPNQVLAVFQQPEIVVNPLFKGQLSIMLDGIQDPGNMGTIIRIADWFGIQHIIAGRESADIFNPKVVQATMGSIGRVNVFYEDLNDFIDKYPDVPVYATTLEGKPLASFGKIKEGIILIGNESKGIKRELIERASYKITIPKVGKAESLNAGVAVGIVLASVV